jgi:hypothetical protein
MGKQRRIGRRDLGHRSIAGSLIVLSKHSHVNGIRSRKECVAFSYNDPFCLFFYGSFALSRLRSNRGGGTYRSSSRVVLPPPEKVLERHTLKRSSEDMGIGRDPWTLPRPLAALDPKHPPREWPGTLLHPWEAKRSISTITCF